MKLRPLPFKKVEQIILGNKFKFVSQKGSHKKYERLRDNREKDITELIRHGDGTIYVGMLSIIIRQTGKSRDEFVGV